MEEWKDCNIGDITTYKKGFAFKLDDYKSSGRRIVKVSNLNQDIYDESKYVYLDLSEVEKHKDVILKKSDIVISTVGSWPNNPNSVVGKVTRIPQYLDGSLLNQNAVIFRGNNEVSQDFLYYLLKDNLFTNYIIGTAQGSASQASIKLTDIMNYPVHLPPLPTQQKIAEILSSLDDKIELNNKINENLEQQAKALFKSWFIDFEPFGGKMPDGWKVGTVSEIIELHDSKRIPLSSQQRENMEKVYPYYGATSLMDYVDDYLFDGIYLLFGEDGTVIDSDGFPILQYVEGKFWVNNHAHILTGKNGFSVEMLYLLFSLTNVQDKVTGAVQPKISQGNLNSIKAIIPDSQVCKEFDSIIQPLFSQIRDLKSENTNLSTICNTLLPKLMSGELDGFIL